MNPNVCVVVAKYELSVSLRHFEKYSTGCQLLPCYYSKMAPTAGFEVSDYTLIGKTRS